MQPKKSLVIYAAPARGVKAVSPKLRKVLGFPYAILGWEPRHGIPLYDIMAVTDYPILPPNVAGKVDGMAWKDAIALLPESNISKLVRTVGGQQALADRMTAAGHPVTQPGVSGWVTRRQVPDDWIEKVAGACPETSLEALRADGRV